MQGGAGFFANSSFTRNSAAGHGGSDGLYFQVLHSSPHPRCCAVLCCAVLCCAVLCCALLCPAVPCCALLCPAVPCCAVPCCALLCPAVPCCALLCPAAPYHAVLCRAVQAKDFTRYGSTAENDFASATVKFAINPNGVAFFLHLKRIQDYDSMRACKTHLQCKSQTGRLT